MISTINLCKFLFTILLRSVFFFTDSSNEFLEGVPCNVVNNCNTNADCIFEKNDRDESVYRCRCRPGFSGDGHRCTMTSLDNLPACTLLKFLCFFQMLHAKLNLLREKHSIC